MNIFMKTTSLLSGLLLIRFALSKLFAWPISVKAFIEMAKPIGIDPTFFRLFTGVFITTICLGYFVNFYLLISNKVKPSSKALAYTIIFYALGAGVMVGALGAEFFLREVPKWPLVIIASFIVITSVISILSLKKLDGFKSLKLLIK